MGRGSFVVRDITEILMHWQAGRSIRRIAVTVTLGVAGVIDNEGIALAYGSTILKRGATYASYGAGAVWPCATWCESVPDRGSRRS
jgi:ABC-type transporter lipoprotein component MlaA